VIRALFAACLFESSDRARALLLRVVAKYRRTPYRPEFEEQYAAFRQTVDSMEEYGFEKAEFNPRTANDHLNAVKKVLYPTCSARAQMCRYP
jgi:hypothetical protein